MWHVHLLIGAIIRHVLYLLFSAAYLHARHSFWRTCETTSIDIVGISVRGSGRHYCMRLIGACFHKVILDITFSSSSCDIDDASY